MASDQGIRADKQASPPEARRPRKAPVWPLSKKLAYSRAQIFALAALSCGAVVCAVWLQQQHGMLPCPWCIVQRMLYLTMAVLLLAEGTLLWACLRGRLGGTGRHASINALSRTVTLVGLAGVGCATWPYFYAAASSSCSQTFADTLWPAAAFAALTLGQLDAQRHLQKSP